jgi:Flp pilus assembly protein TadB
LLTVAVGAGHTPFVALERTTAWCPEPIRSMLGEIRAAHDLGADLDEALRRAGRAHDALRPLTDTLRTSVRLGAPVAPALVRLAAEVRAELRRRAEARARRVPVRLLFPLVFLVLPAFALLTVAPAVLAGFSR